MAFDWTKLTSQELRVTELVASAMDNRQIGAELGISVETVKRHTNNIFNKVGCGSRLELGIWWVTRNNVSREEFDTMQHELGQIIDELRARLRMQERVLRHRRAA